MLRILSTHSSIQKTRYSRQDNVIMLLYNTQYRNPLTSFCSYFKHARMLACTLFLCYVVQVRATADASALFFIAVQSVAMEASVGMRHAAGIHPDGR